MKKSLLAFLMALILIFTFAVPAAGASGFGDKLRNLQEKIGAAFSDEKEDGESGHKVEKLVKKLIFYVEEKCREQGIEPSEALDQVMGLITDEEGNIDLSTVLSLIGLFTSGGTDAGLEPNAGPETEAGENQGLTYYDKYTKREVVLREIILEKYQDAADMGDAQIVLSLTVANEDDDLRETFGRFVLLTYTADGKDLKLCNRFDEVSYMLFDIDEEGNFELKETITAENDDDVLALCEKHKVDKETLDYNADDLHVEWDMSYELRYFLEDHPEYERVEFRGEMKTAEELEVLNDSIFEEILDALDFSF